MALKQVKFLPGVDKQNTTIGAVVVGLILIMLDGDTAYQKKLVVGLLY